MIKNLRIVWVLLSVPAFIAVAWFVAPASATGSILTGNIASWSLQAVISFSGTTISVPSTRTRKKIVVKPRPLTLWKFFIDVCSRLWEWAPKVLKDIKVEWPNVKPNTALYNALQKCIYLGILEQKGRVTTFTGTVDGNFVYDFLWQKLNMSVTAQLVPEEPVPTDVWNDEIRYRIPTYYGIQKLLQLSAWSSNSAFESPLIQSPMFNTFAQVYTQVQQSYHYISGDVSDENLTYGAIKWLVDSLHDKYSVYFPPEEAADFYNSIQWEYYGIGMYVEIVHGKFSVAGVIQWEPAHKAWLQPGDVVLSVNDWIVPEVFTVNEVIRRIKWPADTIVTLTIQRGASTFKVDVKRKKIVLPMLQTKKEGQAVIFTISSFGQGLAQLFDAQVEKSKQDIKNAKSIILDVRNNPGGYLEEAALILSYFVKKWEPVVHMDMKSDSLTYSSEWLWGDVFAWKQIYILINAGSASASEILAWTIKDYIPSAKTVGEKSYGKWSAQTSMGLPNGGSVKYTIALWFTGKTKSSIEKVGIKADVEIKDDPKSPEDEVLQKVLGW